MTRRFFRIMFGAALLLTAGRLGTETLASPSASPAEKTASTLLLHITAPTTILTTAYTQAEDHVRGGSQDRWLTLPSGQGSLRAPWWRQRLSWNMKGPRLEVDELVHFSLAHRAGTPGGPSPISQCGLRPPKDAPGAIRIGHGATLALTPRYRTRASASSVRMEIQATCSLPALKNDPLAVVRDHLKTEREQIAAQLAAGLDQSWPIRDRLAQVWAQLHLPILLDEASQTWLVLNPRATRTGLLGLRDGLLAATVGVLIEPQLVRNAAPAPGKTPLPDSGGALSERGFHATLELPVPFQEATDRLRDALVGQQFGQDLGTVTVQAVRFTPAGDRAQVELDLDLAGLTSLTLQLTGTPVLDEPSQTVSFAHLDYAIARRSALADFAESLLHDEFRRQLERRLVISLGPRLEEARRRLNEELGRDWKGGTLRGQVTTLRLRRLAMERTQFLARVLGEGELHYTISAQPASSPSSPAPVR